MELETARIAPPTTSPSTGTIRIPQSRMTTIRRRSVPHQDGTGLLKQDTPYVSTAVALYAIRQYCSSSIRHTSVLQQHHTPYVSTVGAAYAIRQYCRSSIRHTS
eukprot:3941585-Rhodomonas_salina.1